MEQKKIVRFRRIFVEADDDSFYAWVIENKLPYDVFMACKKVGAVWYVDLSEYERKGFWGWDVLKAREVLVNYGYEVDEASLKKAQEIEERRKALEEMRKKAETLNLTCPKCNQKLYVGAWKTKCASLHCYNCRYDVVVDYNLRVVDAGFRDEKNEEYNAFWWTDKLMERLEDPEGYARKQWEKTKKELRDKAYGVIWNLAINQGEKPPAWVNFPEGEVLEDAEFKPNIYGGGIWYVIQANCIWVIYNNGHDGDDWSLNNVKTGGAGAIGYKLPKTPEIETLVRFRANKNPTDEDYKKLLEVLASRLHR